MNNSLVKKITAISVILGILIIILITLIGFKWIPINAGIITGCAILSAGATVLLAVTNWKENKYSIPGIWTTVGIGGTFISLLMNMYCLQDDTFKIPGKTIEFIKAFASAFTTSLIGITASYIFRLIIKGQESLQYKKLKDNNAPELKSEQHYLEAIEKKIQSIEKTQQWQNSVNTNIVDVTNAVNSLKNDINNKITAIDKKLQAIEEYKKWQKSVVYWLKDLSQCLKTEDSIIISKLSKLIQGQESENTQLTNIYSDTTRILNAFTASANDLVSELTTSLQPTFEQVGKESLKTMNDLLTDEKMGVTAKTTEAIGKMKEELVTVTKKLVDAIDQEKKENKTALVNSIKDLATKLSEELGGIGTSNEELAKEIKKLVVELQDQLKTQSESLAEFGKKQKEINTEAEGFYSKWKNNIELTNSTLTKKMGEVQKTYEKNMSQFTRNLSKRMSSIEKIIDQLNQWQKDNKIYLEETTNSFNQSVNEFNTKTRDSAKESEEIQKLTENISALEGKVSEIVAEKKGLLQEYKNQQELVLTIVKLLNEMDNLKEMIDFIKEYK